jgi:hypothetical protein
VEQRLLVLTAALLQAQQQLAPVSVLTLALVRSLGEQ